MPHSPVLSVPEGSRRFQRHPAIRKSQLLRLNAMAFFPPGEGFLERSFGPHHSCARHSTLLEFRLRLLESIFFSFPFASTLPKLARHVTLISFSLSFCVCPFKDALCTSHFPRPLFMLLLYFLISFSLKRFLFPTLWYSFISLTSQWFVFPSFCRTFRRIFSHKTRIIVKYFIFR